MIEDIIAQNHMIVDTLTFSEGVVAQSALRTISETTDKAGAYAQLLGLTFQEMSDGRCSATLQIRQHLLNPHGIAHGGVTFSLADSTCGGAALSAIGQPRILTQDMQIRYHGPARQGVIEASAEVIHMGKRTITARCSVRQAGALIASATATFAILVESEMSALQPEDV